MLHRALAGPAVMLVLARSLAAQCPNGTPPPCSPTPARATSPVVAPTANGVAVLSFDTRDTTDRNLVDQLSDEIATNLGRVPRLTVKTPSAVQRAQRAAPGDLRAMGRALGVRWVVDGSVRRVASELRVSVRLVDAERETVAWSDAYTRTSTDLLAIQHEIVREVATRVAGPLTPAERATVTARPTANTQAYEHFMRGNVYLRQGGRSVGRAVDEYAAAAKLDAGFGQARAAIAYAYAVDLEEYGGAFTRGMSGDPHGYSLALADSVIRLDPSVSLAWVARGLLLYTGGGTMPGARANLERAVALDPTSAEAQFRLGYYEFSFGEDSAALAHVQRSVALDAAPQSAWLLGILAYYQRRYADAQRMFDSAVVLGEYIGARSAQWSIINAYAAGDTASARTRLDQFIRMDTARVTRRRSAADTLDLKLVTPLFLALKFHRRQQTLALVGRTEEALNQLPQANPTLECRRWVRDPAWDPVRGDLRFRRFEAACLALKEER